VALVVLIGAPGAGKATIARAVVDDDPGVQVAHLDLIGVPSRDEMEREHGSVDGWRRWATAEWMRRLAPVALRGEPVLLEGETRVELLDEAGAAAGGVAYTAVLIDCDDEVRVARLEEDGRVVSGEGDPAADADGLREDAAERGTRVIDTTMRGVASCADEVIRLVRR